MRIVLIIKSIVNLLIGILIIILRESILTYLSFVIAGALLIESIEELIYVFVKKLYKKEHDAVAHPLAITLIGIVLIIENIISPTAESNIEFVCIIWGAVSIFAACKEINEGIHIGRNKKALLHYGEGIISLVFAFLLLMNPLEHVLFHLVVLGIEFIAEAIDLTFHWVRYKAPNREIIGDHLADRIEKVHEYIEEHPTKDEEIYNTIHNKE